MQCEDKGYLLSKSRYNENSVIAEIFTKNHGKISGIVFGATSKKLKNYLQIGNKFHINFNTKNNSQSGYFKVEIDKVLTPKYFENKKKLACIISAMNLIKLLTVELQENTNIFKLINQNEPMPSLINRRLEVVIKNLENFIPSKPRISLLHGDLWKGNILFHNKKLVGLIDPGIFFGHNELEIAYLRWFNEINASFLDYYSEIIKIEKDYHTYEPIYQIYYSLLNVHLWSRKYISDVDRLLSNIFNKK